MRSPLGCNPLRALDDVATGGWWSEEVGGIFAYAVVGAVPECPTDYGVPSGSAFVIGGPFSEGDRNPFGWLVGDGRELVAVSSVDLALQP